MLNSRMDASMDSEALLAAVADDLAEGLVVVDRDRCVRLVNVAAREILGIDGDGTGKRLDDVVADYRLCLMVRNCIETGEVMRRELDYTASGHHLVARALPIVSTRATRPAEVALLLRDDSRLRHLEAVRRDFVANVSHELRTPIAAIQLLVETLQNGALAELDEASEFVAKIGLEVTHMSQMVAELLELSAIESGARPMHPLPTPVTELAAAAERLRPLAEERDLVLTYDLHPETPQVIGDAAQLGQVIRNLVHNAIKFTAPNGSVTLAARGVPGDGRAMVELRVIDTGCGLSREEVARIFERFYKADRSRQRDGEGTGLGLAIARHVVQAHGGSITVDSEPGRGSTFIVTLPAVS
jgi:two-component system, OmpR family, phosphate regulon sensor histidine kinase PhoR